MTQVGAPPYTIAANVRWFAAWILVVALTLTVAGYIAGRLGVGPDLVPLWLGYTGYAAFVLLSGRRFVRKRNGRWNFEDRIWLAVGYAVADGIISTSGTIAAYFTSLVPIWLRESYWLIAVQGTATRFFVELVIGLTLLNLLALATAGRSVAKQGEGQ